MEKNKRYWQIRGYNSTKPIFEKNIPIGSMTERQLEMALKCLVAKAGLSFNEIVSANAKKKTKVTNTLLNVVRENPYPIFRCGDNPYFTAIVIENGKPVEYN